ncbi:MAG: hypothetical protein HC879_16575 [Leptolyngbyaceae cyanobacterium SL_5_9]|nr:hypothetical protein [Leptolyngbyaceae cyanobacterium SL_5_9]NJO75982.1 hypothetical protein [Leptolyngbyaceae cyanobacterium RM1_406_9]
MSELSNNLERSPANLLWLGLPVGLTVLSLCTAFLPEQLLEEKLREAKTVRQISLFCAGVGSFAALSMGRKLIRHEPSGESVPVAELADVAQAHAVPAPLEVSAFESTPDLLEAKQAATRTEIATDILPDTDTDTNPNTDIDISTDTNPNTDIDISTDTNPNTGIDISTNTDVEAEDASQNLDVQRILQLIASQDEARRLEGRSPYAS